MKQINNQKEDESTRGKDFLVYEIRPDVWKSRNTTSFVLLIMRKNEWLWHRR